MQIKDYTPLTTPPSELDKFLVETSEGTRVVPYGVLKEDGKEYFDLVSWKRQTYRGKRFTTGLSTEQVNGIKNGTFDDLFLGDVFTRNGISWVIADFNYFWGRMTVDSPTHVTDASVFEKPHIHIVCEHNLKDVMYKRTGTLNGFVNSDLDYAEIDPQIDEYIYDSADVLFEKNGLNFVTFYELYSNSIVYEKYVGCVWKQKRNAPLNTMAVFGRDSSSLPFSSSSATYIIDSGHNYQLSLFKVHPESILSRKQENANPDKYWLSDVISPTMVSMIDERGMLLDKPPNQEGTGYRPFLILKGTN